VPAGLREVARQRYAGLAGTDDDGVNVTSGHDHSCLASLERMIFDWRPRLLALSWDAVLRRVIAFGNVPLTRRHASFLGS
jgi:hypothetical protein